MTFRFLSKLFFLLTLKINFIQAQFVCDKNVPILSVCQFVLTNVYIDVIMNSSRFQSIFLVPIAKKTTYCSMASIDA